MGVVTWLGLPPKEFARRIDHRYVLCRVVEMIF